MEIPFLPIVKRESSKGPRRLESSVKPHRHPRQELSFSPTPEGETGSERDTLPEGTQPDGGQARGSHPCPASASPVEPKSPCKGREFPVSLWKTCLYAFCPSLIFIVMLEFSLFCF